MTLLHNVLLRVIKIILKCQTMQSQGLNVASLQNIMTTVDKPISRRNTGFPRIAQAYVSHEMKKNFCK
jgi:hypothetical protein